VFAGELVEGCRLALGIGSFVEELRSLPSSIRKAGSLSLIATNDSVTSGLMLPPRAG
jgi:hypothetical protein